MSVKLPMINKAVIFLSIMNCKCFPFYRFSILTSKCIQTIAISNGVCLNQNVLGKFSRQKSYEMKLNNNKSTVKLLMAEIKIIYLIIYTTTAH